MAKKRQTIGNIFAKTAAAAKPADNSDLDTGNVKATGVGLRAGEIAALDAIGAELEVSRNALLRLAARRLIVDYRAGRLDLASMIEPPLPQKKRLALPK